MSTKHSIYPPGLTNANWFSLFNAFSFQVVLGAPMILYAKSIGASATVLGVIASLTPLLNICQIPAAHHLERIGYKRLIFHGWGFRTLIIFSIAFVPLMGFLTKPAKLWFIVISLFVFNLLRGIASGAWLPWLTELIPEAVRGRFLSRDGLFLNAGCLAAVLGCAVLLGEKSHPWQYSTVFFLSAVGGWVSLLCLRRIPDIEPGEALKKSNTSVPWRAIVTYPPFFWLTLFVFLICSTAGCGGVFIIAFLKSQIHYGESQILYLVTLFFAGALVALPMVGRLIDRVGNRAGLFFSVGLFTLTYAAWSLIASDLVQARLFLVGAIYFATGVAGATFGVANVRLMMGTMPAMGRSHFFAFFTVITSLGLGVAPILWGIQIDTLNGWHARTGPVHWNKFSAYFFLQFGLIVLTSILIPLLHEKQPAGRARE